MYNFASLLPPFQPVKLPSLGKLYSSHTNVSKEGVLYLREYAGPEESLISQMNRENAHLIINQIIESCMQDKDIKAEDLTAEDAYFILYWLRVSSYGSAYDMEITCPHAGCGHMDLYSLDLSELTVYDIDENIQEPLIVTLPKTALTVYLKCIRRKTELVAAKRTPAIRQLGFKGDPLDLLRRAYAIEKVITPDKIEVKDRLSLENLCLRFLPSSDSLFLDESMMKFRHGVDTQTKTLCKSCEREIFVTIPGGPEFFRPSRIRNPHNLQDESALRDSYVKQIRELGFDLSEDDYSIGEENFIGQAQETP